MGIERGKSLATHKAVHSSSKFVDTAVMPDDTALSYVYTTKLDSMPL